MSAHARWASAAHRIRAARNPEGLVYSLQHYFGVPVQLHEYQLQWMPLDPQDQTRLGSPVASSVLGQGAIAGEAIPDRQSKFRLVIGPLKLNAYLRLTPAGTPEGSDLAALIELVRAFIGYEYAWEVQLLVHSEQMQTAQLGGTQQLGWSTWLAQNEQQTQAVEGLVMEPEAYAKH